MEMELGPVIDRNGLPGREIMVVGAVTKVVI